MISWEIRQICEKRLTECQKALVKDHSTPHVVVGVGHNHRAGQIKLCICEDLDRDQIIRLLERTIDLIVK